METGVAKAELGEKQVCPNCGAKFYDLRKRPAQCPKCANSFDPADETVRVKRTRGRAATYEPAYEDDEAEDVAVKGEEAGDEEEVEETPELDASAVDEPPLVEDDEEEPTNPDALPAGFSEEEVELEDDGADGPPILELEEDEDFADDELGELPDERDEDERA